MRELEFSFPGEMAYGTAKTSVDVQAPQAPQTSLQRPSHRRPLGSLRSKAKHLLTMLRVISTAAWDLGLHAAWRGFSFSRSGQGLGCLCCPFGFDGSELGWAFSTLGSAEQSSQTQVQGDSEQWQGESGRGDSNLQFRPFMGVREEAW